MNYEMRINKLQQMICLHQLDGALLLYSRDVFYYLGTAQPSYFIILPDDYILFVKDGIDFVREDVHIDQLKIREEDNLESIFKEIFVNGGRKKIATELDTITVKQFRQLERAYPNCEFVNVSPLILEQRRKKESEEIHILRKACISIHNGHKAVLSELREGLTELELAAAAENAHRLAGHEGTFFIRMPDFFMSHGPISSGINLLKKSGVLHSISGIGLSASVPVGPSRKFISRGEPIIIDIPTHVEGYHADQARTYVIGEASDTIRSMYITMKDMADSLISYLKPGLKCSDLYRLAMDMAKEMGCAEQFLSFGKGRKSRLIGHGIGLEVNEPPTLSEYDQSIIEENNVITLELHMMDDHAGVVKLEDMIVIREKGNEILTISPRDLVEIK